MCSNVEGHTSSHLQLETWWVNWNSNIAYPSLYILRKDGETKDTMLIHVDNILLGGDTTTIQEVEKQLTSEFKLTCNKKVSHFLSFDITQNKDTRTFTMDQSAYVNNLIHTILKRQDTSQLRVMRTSNIWKRTLETY